MYMFVHIFVRVKRGGEHMNCYKKMYLHLFNRATDAIRRLEVGQNAEAQQILQDAQAECEEFFLSMEADEDETLLP